MPKGLIKPDMLATEEVLGEALESRCGHSTALFRGCVPCPAPAGPTVSAGWALFCTSAQCCGNWACTDSDQAPQEESEAAVGDAGTHVTVWAEGGEMMRWNKGGVHSATGGKWALGWGC